MTSDTSKSPEYDDRPFYGYDSSEIQDTYTGREAVQIAGFLMPRLEAGMSLLDCGCGPGALTFGLAEAVAPGRAVGVDLEPGMIESANRIADDDYPNLEFRVGDINDLPFEDDEFDVVFSSAVTEHLPDPIPALRELRRVTKPGGLTAVIRTEWTFPFIVPECAALSRFLDLFEGGFRRQGGSLNRGRYIRSDMMEAGFEIVEFAAGVSNYTTPEAVSGIVEGYISWMENIPIFSESVELGLVTPAELDEMKVEMREWARLPDAFFANARAYAIGTK